MISVGRTVLYKLSAGDVLRIRTEGTNRGNYAEIGQVLPLIVARVWPNEYGDKPGVNGQVILDGPDSLWVTSVAEGDQPGQWMWPERQ